ncbi:hypothetical protein D7V88_12510 [Corallococcus terminator]|uniref:Uncharacterized protein n=1 Tax=Corallococcus terminator TaxID=2316733 RepID=A0A3A8J219_9BACT|nr:hypothetical protein D7V88_12510 [Corallococcus terminator]
MPVVSLLLVLVGFVWLALLPMGLLLHLWGIDRYTASIATALAVLALCFRVRGWARGVALVSVVFALLFFMRVRGESHQMSALYRMHAVAPRVCQEALVNNAVFKDPEARAIELAGMSPRDAYSLLLSCKKEGAETSITDGFDTSWTLGSDGGLRPF